MVTFARCMFFAHLLLGSAAFEYLTWDTKPKWASYVAVVAWPCAVYYIGGAIRDARRNRQ